VVRRARHTGANIPLSFCAHGSDIWPNETHVAYGITHGEMSLRFRVDGRSMAVGGMRCLVSGVKEQVDEQVGGWMDGWVNV
jgi:hypothetical protein